MMKSSSALRAAENEQKAYNRSRDSPFFYGMRREDEGAIVKHKLLGANEKATSRTILRSSSDIVSRNINGSEVHESPTYSFSPSKDSLSDIVLEPFGQSASGRWLRITEPISSPLPELHSGLEFNFMVVNESTEVTTPKVSETDEGDPSPNVITKPPIERSYTVKKRIEALSKVRLPPSAALFYNGHSPMMEIIESCQSIYRLNTYLKAIKYDVHCGVPGRFLQAVLGPDTCDVGSIVSTIMYAFYLHKTQQSKEFCTVPVLNTKRANLDSHGEVKWLLDSCRIDQSSLLFADEIDLPYYDLFGSLKLVLVNSSRLPDKQEALKEALVEIVSCKKLDNIYPWVENTTLEEEASCCTVIAEKFALTSPKILGGQGLSRFLLAGILLDTGNLRHPHTSSKDKYMSTLLINGAGRFGCNGLYQILRYKMYDLSDLTVGEILRKDLKKWNKTGKPGNNSRLTMSNIGMSSIGISVAQLLSLIPTSDAEISHFQRTEKLSLLVIVSGYYDNEKNFKREILISGDSHDILKTLVQFIFSCAPKLPLKPMHLPDMSLEMRAFEVDRVSSRKIIERLLDEFVEMSK